MLPLPLVVFQPQPHRSGCTDDAPDKIPKGWPGCGECILSIARLKDPDDKYLQLFTRDEQGGDPVNISVSSGWTALPPLADPEF